MKFKDQNTEPSGEFATVIRDFRAAVTHVAERETAHPMAVDWLAPARKRRRSHQQRMVLAWACAAALCFATVPFAIMPLGTHSGPAPIHMARQAPAPLIQSSETENGLLEQVDEQVSESVPSSLAPLQEMENMNTASANGPSDPFVNGAALAQLGSTDASH